MSSTYAVQVSGIAPSTTESQFHDFFAFCGKITSIDYDDKAQPKSATIRFEKPSAAKTALMLNGGPLDGSHLTVSSEAEDAAEEEAFHHHEATLEGGVEQSDKPRAGIAAEYIAKGYALSDQVLHHAIELDNKHGISKTFLAYFHSVDSTVGQKTLGPEKTISGKVQEGVSAGIGRAKTIDEQKGISKRAGDYYTQALGSPFGQKVRAFYTSTSKQVQDIHEEARRIAAEQKPSGSFDIARAPGSGSASEATAKGTSE